MKEKVLEDSLALMEMYKAGFLDGYRKGNKVSTKPQWASMNKDYQKAFSKRFAKKITRYLKKKEKKK